MRRIGRVLGNAFAVLSLVAALLVAGLWARSHRATDYVGTWRGAQGLRASTYAGTLSWVAGWWADAAGRAAAADAEEEPGEPRYLSSEDGARELPEDVTPLALAVGFSYDVPDLKDERRRAILSGEVRYWTLLLGHERGARPAPAPQPANKPVVEQGEALGVDP